MSKEKSVQDKSMASRMKDMNKKHPGYFPDSITPGWKGNGWEDRKESKKLTSSPVSNSAWESGMLGGVLAYRLGLSKINPLEGH